MLQHALIAFKNVKKTGEQQKESVRQKRKATMDTYFQ